MSDYLRDDRPSFVLQQNMSNSLLDEAATSTIAMTLLFGSIIFATSSLAARLWLTGLWSWRNTTSKVYAQEEKSQQLDITSLPSIYSLLYYSTVFGLILFYSYLCEHHPPYFHEEKTYDRDEFFFWTILVVVFAGGHSLKRNEIIKRKEDSKKQKASDNNNNNYKQLKVIDEDDNSDNDDETKGVSSIQKQTATRNDSNNIHAVLNRYQTEEWKGIMQITFLLYHYMHAMEIYNGIRVMITCYVWMTGFGNFSFFYMKNDYSLHRVLQMLWRLNFLVFFLCLTHGNPYILYYICPLHTYFFFMVYVVMYIGKEKNYTRWWLRMKIGVTAVIIYLLWDVDSGLFELVEKIFFLSNDAIAGATIGSKWEWYFRSYLDHWSTLLGMIFALNYPIISLFYERLEVKRTTKEQWMGKLAIAAVMLIVFGLWATGPLVYGKIAYNSTNPYFGCIPLLTYIFLRNLTPRMRSCSMEFMHEIGKTTLETYLMQHHIWLTSNSKTILVFVPGWPRVNLALVTYLYVILSRKLHKLTLIFRGMLLPNDRQACINSVMSIGVVISGFYCTAFLLESMDMTSGFTVGMLSMLCGALLYQSVVDSSWSLYRQTVKEMKNAIKYQDDDHSFTSQSDVSVEEGGKDETVYSRLCPPLIGAMVVILLGLSWNEFAAAGASSIGPLPPRCDAFVNNGIWIPIDGCNESSRGMAFRNYGAASYGTCQPHGNSYVWAWRDQPSRTHCRFGHRNEARLKKALSYRQIVFVGDSMTRYVYHASMRAMGIANSGEYDATGPKHADISHILWGNTPIDFRWAPLATDQLSTLKEINKQATGSAGNKHPDLIVLGGGAWDRLHVYASDEDRQSHAATLKELAHEMQKAQDAYGSAVVWFIPTTINSQALNTEEKRDHMREEDMEAMRAVYSNNGILSSSSFVIDGPAFTSSRVSESYDGVHYPIDVYSAGAQILFNALDWLLPPGITEPVVPPRIGKLANPVLGLMMLILVAIGLVAFDGFLGFSYLASLFVSDIMPKQLEEEAYSALHKQIGVSGGGSYHSSSGGGGGGRRRLELVKPRNSMNKSKRDSGSVDEEIAALLGSNRRKDDMSSVQSSLMSSIPSSTDTSMPSM